MASCDRPIELERQNAGSLEVRGDNLNIVTSPSTFSAAVESHAESNTTACFDGKGMKSVNHPSFQLQPQYMLGKDPTIQRNVMAT
eukprot:c44664_g1_i1 orf=1-252(-)